MLLEVRPLGRVVSMKCAMVRPKTMLEIESKVFTVTIMFPTQPFSTTFSGDEDVGPGTYTTSSNPCVAVLVVLLTPFVMYSLSWLA